MNVNVKINLETKQSLEKLLTYGKEKNIFIFTTISSKQDSCCSSKLEVIDFDKTKEKTKHVPTLKSCDFLKVLPNSLCIDFIEMKSSKEFIERDLSHNMNNSNIINSKIKRKSIKYNFEKKIKDSISVLQLIINLLRDILNENEIFNITSSTKNFFILTDIEKNEDKFISLALKLKYLAEASSLPSKIIKEMEHSLNDINTSLYTNLQKPKIMSCSEIDNYYNN